ncbi:MAG: hypothetical protein AAGJ82_07520 [Bacteroidota bacterium]
MRLLTILLLWGLSSALFAQDYLPFLHPDNRWQVDVDLTETIWVPDARYEYFLQGDTLINDTIFTKMYRHDLLGTGGTTGPPAYGFPVETGPAYLAALLWEDVDARRVQLRQWYNSDGEEQLAGAVRLYDFLLEPGEEIFDPIATNGPYIISNVSQEVLQGEIRTVLTTEEGNSFAEGMGSLAGPLEGISTPVSGLTTSLQRLCQGTAMDCGIQIDGMVNTRRQWNVLHSLWSFAFGNASHITHYYRLGDSSTLGQHLYYELVKMQQKDEPGFTSDIHSIYLDNSVYLREDAGVVYQYKGDGDEIVLYNFNLEPGDTITYESYASTDSLQLIVNEVDSVWVDDTYRRRLRLAIAHPTVTSPETTVWIAGIGEISQHPLEPRSGIQPFFDAAERFQCYYSDYAAEATYTKPDFMECYTYLVDTEEIAASPVVSLSPNPGKGLVRFDPSWNDHQWQFYNALGQLQFDQIATAGRLDLTNLTRGWYRYLVLNRNGKVVGQGRWLRQ